ncbi:MAG: PIG-L deacetylase family protein [Minisyncoccia bacterium]|jgi:LmbE family N-acetylglucosaminyl deacetylase
MKPIVCIFAHPDDEAFGPGGTIAKLARTREVYIICATKGETGGHRGKGEEKSMGRIRAKELRRSAKTLGVKRVFFLGFLDGTLCNNLYHHIARKAGNILKKLKPDTILSYEPRGVSGHTDHVTIAMVSSYLFGRLPFIKKHMQFCVRDTPERRKEKYFIYRPPGYKKSEIDFVSDVRDVWDTKVQAIAQHTSQVYDIKRILKRYKKFPKVENFLVRMKKN